MIDIISYAGGARYSSNLEAVANKLGGIEILRVNYGSYDSGFVDIDILLEDGKVFSYLYSYGSCSSCDEWEAAGLSDSEIEAEMEEGATIFPDRKSYEEWVENCKSWRTEWRNDYDKRRKQ